MKFSLVILCVFCIKLSFSQDSIPKISPMSISGYLEVYYSYDFNKPVNNDKPAFLYSHNRHNEFNLNLGFIKVSYAAGRVRSNLSLATGTYMNANYAAEPGLLKNIYEANAGIKISKLKNLWVDAGIFSSHIGFESAVSKDCWNLTRSIVAENSPYFESGAKITYLSDNNKWLFSGLLLNGWQRIKRIDGNSLMSFGTQVQYKPTLNTTINYSTFIGTDTPDSSRLLRYYHNLYAIFKVGKVGITTGFDIGMQQKSKRAADLDTWTAPVLVLRYPLNDLWLVGARAEYYSDPHGVIISTSTVEGFKTTAYSVNIDYFPLPNAALRVEARTFHSNDKIFLRSDVARTNNSMLTASLALSF